MQGWVRIDNKEDLHFISQHLDEVGTLAASFYSRENGGSGWTHRCSCVALKSSLLTPEPAMEPLCCNVTSTQVLSFF